MTAAFQADMSASDLIRCHTVPVLTVSALVTAALLATGCYASHRGSSEPPFDAAPRDAGPDAAVPLPLDSGPLFDAGPDSGPPDEQCAPATLDVACTDTLRAAVPVNQPYDLPIYFGAEDACLCGQRVVCAASLADDGVLDLSTEVCQPLFPCEACIPFLGDTCRLPPLGEGVVHVRVNGLDAFDLNVSDVTPEAPADECHTFPRDAIGCGWERRVDREAVDQICLANGAEAGEPIPVQTTDFCLPCSSITGPCAVAVDGLNVHIQYTSIESRCPIDCDMECTFAETECVIPPLLPGSYAVTVDNVPGSLTLEVGPPPGPGRLCLSVPEG